MAQLWPFKPLTPMTEVLEWRTDVIRAHGNEQRIRLRPGARRSFEMQHVMTTEQYSAAQEIIRRFEDYLIPDWTQRLTLAVGLSPGMDIAITLPSCLDWLGAEQAVIYVDWATNEVVDITVDSDNNAIIAVVAQALGPALMLPVYDAVISDGIGTNKLTRDVLTTGIRALLLLNYLDPLSDYVQYRGFDVMTDCPIVQSGLGESIEWPVQQVDNGIGQFFFLRERGYPDTTFTMRWRLHDLCELKGIKQWLSSRYGKQKAFWLSSRTKDFLLAVNVLSIDTTIKIKRLSAVIPLARTDFDIEVKLITGVFHRYRVISWTIQALTITLVITGTAGFSFTVSDVERISNLHCVRLNSDRFELVHHAVSGAELAVPCIGVLVPAS